MAPLTRVGGALTLGGFPVFAKIYVRFILFLSSDEGATATEYGLLVFFIAIALVGGVLELGNTLNAWYHDFSVAVDAWPH